MRLLVVEDEKKLCDMIAKSLHQAGYEVDTCNDGEEALDMIYAEMYDFCLLYTSNDSLFLKLQSDGRLCTEFPAMERWSAAGGSFSVSCGPDAAWLILQKEGGKG